MTEMKVFDWAKAAEIIRDKKPKKAEAGLSEDWFWTGDTIFANKKPCKKSSPYLWSYWATPILRIIDRKGYSKDFPCYKTKNIDSKITGTVWPGLL